MFRLADPWAPGHSHLVPIDAALQGRIDAAPPICQSSIYGACRRERSCVGLWWDSNKTFLFRTLFWYRNRQVPLLSGYSGFHDYSPLFPFPYSGISNSVSLNTSFPWTISHSIHTFSYIRRHHLKNRPDFNPSTLLLNSHQPDHSTLH